MSLSDLKTDILDQFYNDIDGIVSGSENTIIIVFGLVAFIICFFLTISTNYNDPYSKTTEVKKTPLVSLFVSVRNDEKLIVDCINSMINQTYTNKEIFVVDDASTDNTAKVIEKAFGTNDNIQIIYLKENIGKKRALAKAIIKSKGEILAFTDSDSKWQKEAIEKVVAIFDYDSDIGAVCGHCNASNASENILTKMQDSWYEKQYRFRKGFESTFGSVSCVSGPIACYRRATIYNYIPPWENDTFLGKEFRFATDRTMTGFALDGANLGPKIKTQYSDSDFIKKEYYPSKNWKIVYSKSVQAWTSVPNNLEGMIKQRIRWNKSFIRNLFFTGKFYWKQPLIPALYYYSHILYVLLSPILIFSVIGYLVLNDYFSIIGIAFMGSVLISYLMNLTFSSKKLPFLGAIVNILYQIILPILLIYSILTIREMKWSRNSTKAVK